jgi:hypothetical protein
MFFVADGMTTDEAEFEAAVRAFIKSLAPESLGSAERWTQASGLHMGMTPQIAPRVRPAKSKTSC